MKIPLCVDQPWIWSILTLFWALAGSLPASEASPSQPSLQKSDTPSGTLLNPAPAFSQWAITFQYLQDFSKSDNTPLPNDFLLPRKVVFTKTNDIIHQEITNVAGQNIDSWQVGSNMYVKLPDQNYWGVYDSTFRADNSGANPLFLPLPPVNFHDLEFVISENFIGETKSNGKKLLTFSPPGESRNAPPANDSSMLEFAPITMVQIDDTTRLPLVHSIKGKEVRTYTFLSPPSSMLQLPPALLQQFKKVEEHRAKYNGPMKRE
jgi:hypothetical protein